jgi:exopolysaccharide production protein ExoZ
MYFYAIFALSMAISHKYRVATTAAFIVLVVAVETARPSGIGLIGVYSNNIVIEFVFGMVVARLFAVYGAVWPRGLTLVLAMISMVLMLLFSGHQDVLPRFLGWGVPSAMLVWCALMLDRTKFAISRVAVLAGDCSYSLYLSHLFVISTLRIVWIKLHLPVGTWTALLLFMVVAAVLACPVAAAFYKLAEEPIARALRRFRSAPPPVRAAAA